MGRDDLRTIHEYHVQQTVFADAKAGVLILIFSGVLGALAAKRLDQTTLVFKGHGDGQILWLVAPFGLLFLAILLLILVLAPRRTQQSGRQGVIYWGHVAEFPDSKSYLARIKGLSATDSDDAWTSNIHTLGRIVAVKFELMTWAIWIGVVGSALALLAFATMEPSNPDEPASVMIVFDADPRTVLTGPNTPTRPVTQHKAR